MRNRNVLLVLAILLVAGCSPRWEKNVVGEVTGGAAGKRPNAMLRVADGTEYRLSAFYGEATLIAFTEQACAAPDSELVKVSKRLRGRITTVEVAEPAGGREAHAKCTAERGEPGQHLVSLYDEQAIVRKRLGAPPNSALVMDRWGDVIARGSLDDLDSLADEAQALIDRADWELAVEYTR
jgi:hypothetical protein